MTKINEQTVRAIALAIVDTVREMGSHGAPGGVLYAALMSVGLSLESFQTLMGALVEAGVLRQEGHQYFATA